MPGAQNGLRRVVFVIVVVQVLCWPIPGFAFNEVFQIGVKEAEYRGDFDFDKLTRKNAIPLWVRVDSNTQLTVSLTSNFQSGTTFPLLGFFYFTKAKSAALIASVSFSDGSYMAVQGTANFDKRTGRIRQIRGIFVQSGVFTAGCFSSGRFKAKQ